MPDEVQQGFVRSIIAYLKKQVDTHTLTEDAAESVEVAIQCLQVAFGVGEEEETSQAPLEAASGESSAATDANTATPTSTSAADPIDLYEMFQSVYIERSPDLAQKAEAIKNEGNRLMKEGKYNEALLQYNRAIAFDPKNSIFYCNRAAAHIRLGDNERGITDCKLALTYNPTYSKAYGRMGTAYSNLGKFEEAQAAYLKAMELEPENQEYRNNLESARNARSQGGGGVPLLNEALNSMLSNPNIRQIFGNADLDLGQLRDIAQNPMIINMMSQMFGGAQGGGGAAPNFGMGNQPPVPNNDLMQLFQSVADQLATSMNNPNANSGGGDNHSTGGNQPPPST